MFSDGGEVEDVEVLVDGEPRRLDPGLQGVGVSAGDLEFRQAQQVGLMPLVPFGGLAGQLLELRGDRRKSKLLEVGLQQQHGLVSHRLVLLG